MLLTGRYQKWRGEKCGISPWVGFKPSPWKGCVWFFFPRRPQHTSSVFDLMLERVILPHGWRWSLPVMLSFVQVSFTADVNVALKPLDRCYFFIIYQMFDWIYSKQEKSHFTYYPWFTIVMCSVHFLSRHDTLTWFSVKKTNISFSNYQLKSTKSKHISPWINGLLY